LRNLTSALAPAMVPVAAELGHGAATTAANQESYEKHAGHLATLPCPSLSPLLHAACPVELRAAALLLLPAAGDNSRAGSNRGAVNGLQPDAIQCVAAGCHDSRCSAFSAG